MRNKNILFCSVHRYDANRGQEKSLESILNDFTEVNLITDSATKLMVQKGLENNYEITDEESTLMAIEELLSNGLYLHPFFSILYDLLLNRGLDFRQVASKTLSELGITDTYVLDKLRVNFKSYEQEEEEFIVSSIENQLTCFLEDTEICSSFMAFSERYSLLIQLAYPYPFVGYDYYRVYDVLEKAYAIGYLSADKLTTVLEELTQSLQNKFGSWQQYWASVLLGKVYTDLKNKHAQNVFLLDQNTFIRHLYQLLQSYPKLFTQSEIWPNSEFGELLDVIEKLFFDQSKSSPYLLEYGSNAQIEEKSISLLNKYILKPLAETHLLDYFKACWDQNQLSYALIDKNKGTCFWKKIQAFKEKHELFFSEEEIPLLVFNRSVLTTKGFYSCKKKLFIEKIDVIPLGEVDFTYTVSSIKTAYLSVNGKSIAKNSLAANNQINSSQKEADLISLHQRNLDKIASIFNTACTQLASRKSSH